MLVVVILPCLGHVLVSVEILSLDCTSKRVYPFWQALSFEIVNQSFVGVMTLLL